MAQIIAAAVARLKDQVHRFLSAAAIAQVAGELGLAWRNTPLAVPNLVALFARQILGGNLSMPELVRLANSAFTPEAYCTARARLPLELLRELLRRVCVIGGRQVKPADPRRWKGHRVWHMDGSSFSMPDTPELQAAFGQPGGQADGCGFPVAHILCLFDVATGLVSDCIVSPLRTHDMQHASELHGSMEWGDILVADRAFESYFHLALLLQRGMHLVMPAHQKRQVDFRRKERRRGKKKKRLERLRLRRCGHCDQIVRWTKPRKKPKWMTPAQFDALPETIEMREIKRTVRLDTGHRQVIVLVTTLLDEKLYPAEELVKLLQGRWQVEVNLRHLKTTMKMGILRSQTVDGVRKELWMFLIVYNLVRLIMLEASQRRAVEAERISFADVLYWVRHGDLSGEMPAFQLLPIRPGRVEPRVLKRRRHGYPLMKKPRSILRKAMKARGM
jgi:hypothetical protein